jgi:hypothetical protein
VVRKDVDDARQVHQQKPADGGVERFLIQECARVTEAKVDVAEADPVSTLHGHGDLGGILLDAHHGSVGPDHLRDLKRGVARPGAEVEDPHARPNAAALKEQSRRLGDECGLHLQTRDLRVVAVKSVFGFGHTAYQRQARQFYVIGVNSKCSSLPVRLSARRKGSRDQVAGEGSVTAPRIVECTPPAPITASASTRVPSVKVSNVVSAPRMKLTRNRGHVCSAHVGKLRLVRSNAEVASCLSKYSRQGAGPRVRSNSAVSAEGGTRHYDAHRAMRRVSTGIRSPRICDRTTSMPRPWLIPPP